MLFFGKFLRTKKFQKHCGNASYFATLIRQRNLVIKTIIDSTTMYLYSNTSDKDNTKTTVVLLEIGSVENSISHLLVDMTFEESS